MACNGESGHGLLGGVPSLRGAALRSSVLFSFRPWADLSQVTRLQAPGSLLHLLTLAVRPSNQSLISVIFSTRISMIHF